jgi:hypothetical protein
MTTKETEQGIWQAVRRWWHGDWKPYDTSGVIGLYYDQHWTARACHFVIDYVRKHYWKIIMAVIAVVGIIFAGVRTP